MTPAEVDAVLELWREVEGTEPPRMAFAGAGYFIRPGDGAVIHDNDASDLLCGHLRRWLEARCYRIDLTAVSDEARGLGLHPFEVKLVMKPSYAIVWRDAPTLLLALIAAVLAVAGTSNTPTAADAAGD